MKSLSIRPTTKESQWGWVYLGIDLLVLPIILVSINSYLPDPLPNGILNIILYTINFLCVAVIFWRFLWESLKFSGKYPFKCLQSALFGFALYMAANYLLSAGIGLLWPDFRNANDQSIADMLQQHRLPMELCTIFLVPLTEEVLFRGLLFQGLYPKHKLAAYAASSAAFAAIHVVGYMGIYDTGFLIISFLQYLPAGLALAYAYARADSIWAPILMHITINQIAVTAMR